MSNEESDIKDELIQLIKEKFTEFITWIKPNSIDNLLIQILKFVLKLPIILFMTLISPILFIILGIIFIVVI